MNQNQPPRRPPSGGGAPNRPPQHRPAQGSPRPQQPDSGLGRPVRTSGAPNPQRPATYRPAPQRPQASRPLIHPARTARLRRRRQVILAVLATVALICLILVGLIIGELVSAIGTMIDRTDRPDSGVTTTTSASNNVSDPAGTGTSDSGNIPPTPTGMTMTTVQKTKADIAVGNLLLINAEHAYIFPDHTPSSLVNLFDNRPYVTTENGNKVRAYQVRNTSQMLDRLALEALNGLIEEFYAEYKVTHLMITWAHRTLQEQQDLYNLYVADYPGYSDAQIKKLLKDQVDTPGYSEHHLGTGIDIKIYTDSGVTLTLDDEPGYFSWLKENAPKYGFIHRYPTEKKDVTGVVYDPYHFRYVGAPHAKYIHDNGLCLEEYLNELAATTAPDGKHLTVTTDDGVTYEVYYVKATGEMTDVPVPTDYPYAISGDNANGFIVTVTVS